MKKRIVICICGLLIILSVIVLFINNYHYQHDGCIMYMVAAKEKDYYIEARSFGFDDREFSGQHKNNIREFVEKNGEIFDEMRSKYKAPTEIHADCYVKNGKTYVHFNGTATDKETNKNKTIDELVEFDFVLTRNIQKYSDEERTSVADELVSENSETVDSSAPQIDDVDKEEKFLPSSLGITIPNINLGAVKDERPLDEEEIEYAVQLGKTLEEAKKMTRYELVELDNRLHPENKEKEKENTEKFTPSAEELKTLEERNITVDDFQYLHKLYSDGKTIFEQSDETLAKDLKEWYISKIEYAKAASTDPAYSEIDISQND